MRHFRNLKMKNLSTNWEKMNFKSNGNSAHNTQFSNLGKALNIYTHSFKQPVCRQLDLGWQIAKQLSGLSPLSLSNNKNCRLKKRVFPL